MPCAEMPGDSLALYPHAVSPIPGGWASWAEMLILRGWREVGDNWGHLGASQG